MLLRLNLAKAVKRGFIGPQAAQALRDSLALLMISVAGAASAFVVSVIVGRSLPPSEMATFAWAISLVASASVIAELGSSQIILRSFKESSGGQTYWDMGALRLASALVVAVCVAIIVLLAPRHMREAGLLAIATFPTLILVNFRGFPAIARGRPVPYALARVAERAAFVILAWLAIRSGYGVTGVMVAALATGVVLLVALPRVVPPPPPVALTKSLPAWRSYLRESGWFAAAAIVGIAIGRLNLLVAPFIMGATEAALFSAAFLIVESSTILVNALYLSTLPRISARLRQGPLPLRLVLRYSLLLLVAAVPVPLAFAFLGGPIMNLVYGEPYGAAGSVLAVLSVNLLIAMASLPTSLAADASGNQHIHIVNGAMMMIANIVGIVLAVGNGPLALAVAVAAARSLGLLPGAAIILWTLKAKGKVA